MTDEVEERAREWYESNRAKGDDSAWELLTDDERALVADAYRSAAEAPIRRVLEKVETSIGRCEAGEACSSFTSAKQAWASQRDAFVIVRDWLLAELTPEGRSGG